MAWDHEEFRDRLHDIGMDCNQFAAVSGWSRDTVREWGKRSPVPRPARVMVDLLKRVQGEPDGPPGGQ